MLADRLADVASQIDTKFDDILSQGADSHVTRAMRYAVKGGKHIRAFLVMEGARLYGVADDQSVWSATAIEAMHSYSLIHDDLPCMDDDDLRRGRPTVHVKWDEATAVLAGDALQTLAFELLSSKACAPDPATRVTLLSSLAAASGRGGMVLGQAQDIAAETANTPLSLDQIVELQRNKTGALIEWAATAGPMLARADLTEMRLYSRALGLAFQIADDILDVEGDAKITGKRTGKDADAGKATFVSLLGLQGAKDRAADLIDEAENALSDFGSEADALRQVARFVISRDV